MPASQIVRTGLLPVAVQQSERLWAFLASRLRGRWNRAAIRRLDSFSDHELADIGLTRTDVRSALEGTRFFEDPSRRLATKVRGRRHG